MLRVSRPSSRIIFAVAALAAVSATTGPAAATDAVLAPCKSPRQTPGVPTPSQIAALDLLASVTQLWPPRGHDVLPANLALAVAINNHSSAAVRARALADAQVTDANAFTLADGLGATMADIYRRKARFESADDGKTKSCGAISPAVSAAIAAANTLSGGDSNAGKFAFADGLKGAYTPPPGGTTDVLGIAYERRAGTPGADKVGNSRPFQTAPLDATSGPHIESYDGIDVFGRAMNSRVVLTGATEAETAAGLNGSDLSNSPSFPSGHTTFGYTEALILALMVPERLRALAYRGSEYGHSRIVLGAHYPIDVIAGRTLATYDLAQDLAGRASYAVGDGGSFQAILARAAADLRNDLRQNGCPSIALCAREPIVRAADAAVVADGQPKLVSPRDAYAFRLTYGLPAIGATDLPPEPVPEEAGFLLQSRFPYLTQAQRREVLRTTEGPSGHFLDASPLDGRPLAAGKGPAAQAGVYSRLDLFAAAGGYASLAGQVVVEQDPAAVTDPNLQPFADLARVDDWSNDIGGPGGLTKRGGGTLRLSGRDTFKGPAIVQKGTLEIAGSLAAGTRVESGGTLAGAGSVGDVRVAAGGTLAPGAVDGSGALAVKGSLALAKDAALALRPDAKSPTLVQVEGRATIDGALLSVESRGPLPAGTRLTVLAAKGGVGGTFAGVTLDTPSLRPELSYGANAVYLTLKDARTSP